MAAFTALDMLRALLYDGWSIGPADGEKKDYYFKAQKGEFTWYLCNSLNVEDIFNMILKSQREVG